MLFITLNRTIKIFFLVFATSIGLSSFGQLDTSYIYDFDNYISLGGKIGAINNNFIFTNDSLRYNLNSNTVPTVAVWFKYKKWPTIAISIPVSVFTPDTLAKTSGLTLDLKGQVAKGFILDGFLFYEKGFNLQDRNNLKDIKPMKDSYSFSGNLELFYILNYKKLSYKSAYLFGEIQKKSAGSFLVGTGFGFFRLRNQKSFFDNISDANSNLNFNDVSTLNYTLSGGYIHTVVFGREKKWMANGAITVGGILNGGNIKYFDIKEKEKILNIGLITKYKVALVHNFKNWNIGLTSVGSFITFRPSENTIMNTNVIDIKFSTIYKFKAPSSKKNKFSKEIY